MKTACWIGSCISCVCSTWRGPTSPADRSSRIPIGRLLALLLLAGVWDTAAYAIQDSGVIRLQRSSGNSESASAEPDGIPDMIRRGFDFEAFESRLEALWFQRKAFLADGRDEAALRQAELIRAFCDEEGVKRVEPMAGALLAETRRNIEAGEYDRAVDALNFAAALDPGRSQIHLARAEVLWKSGRGRFAAAGELFAGLRAAVTGAVADMSLVNRLALIGVVALAACLVVFSLLMLVKYQSPLRHEIEERLGRLADERWMRATGWAVVLLPLIVWFAAGWIAFYWIVATFRYMAARERVAAVVLLLASIAAFPAYRFSVAIYGVTADPLVRTTITAANSEYAPDRVLKLQKLVAAYPDDATFRFLLAGIYKQGKYFEEAFAEYKAALTIDPFLYQAHINVGNIFLQSGQPREAVPQYRKALDLAPNSVVAYFNMHLAQSETFRFKEAEQSLVSARALEPRRVAELMAGGGEAGNRAPAVDAQLGSTSIWEAALSGRSPRERSGEEAEAAPVGLGSQLLNSVSIVAALSLVACGLVLGLGRSETRARPCIRCGKPFCHFCKSSREGNEYCMQCLHLYVLGDGLAPEAKNHKLYEVERHERRTRFARKAISFVLPGGAQILRGRSGFGLLLMLLWFASLIAWRPEALRPVERLLGADLRLDLLASAGVPSAFYVNAFGMSALIAVILVWFLGNVWRFRRQASLD